jgi:hypothetical protein
MKFKKGKKGRSKVGGILIGRTRRFDLWTSTTDMPIEIPKKIN